MEKLWFFFSFFSKVKSTEVPNLEKPQTPKQIHTSNIHTNSNFQSKSLMENLICSQYHWNINVQGFGIFPRKAELRKKYL